MKFSHIKPTKPEESLYAATLMQYRSKIQLFQEYYAKQLETDGILKLYSIVDSFMNYARIIDNIIHSDLNKIAIQ